MRTHERKGAARIFPNAFQPKSRRMLMRRWPTVWLAALLGLAGTCGAWAQTGTAFPDRPVRLVLAFGPGGLADVTFRLVAEKLTGLLGKQVLVENRSEERRVGKECRSRWSP